MCQGLTRQVGDFSVAINVMIVALVTSGQTISGGTGNDTVELNGSYAVTELRN